MGSRLAKPTRLYCERDPISKNKNKQTNNNKNTKPNKKQHGAREMALWLRVHTAFAEDQVYCPAPMSDGSLPLGSPASGHLRPLTSSVTYINT